MTTQADYPRQVIPTMNLKLQAVLTSWGGSRWLGVQQQRALSQGWQASRRSFRPFTAAASAGGTPEQPIIPPPVGTIQEPPVQQQQQQQQQPHDAWEQACQQVAAFQQQHGRLPKARADAQGPLLPGERPLGVWCTQQQRRKAGSKGLPLTAQEREALLAIPGWAWWVTKRVRKPWEQRRQEVEAFYRQHGWLPRYSAGNSNPSLHGEKDLGTWIHDQRQLYRGHKRTPLSAERIAALEATPGWVWEDKTPWEARYQQVQDFVRLHGRLPRKKGGKSSPLLPCEQELGKWCSTQRFKGKGQQPSLTAEQRAALAALPGWYWDVEVDRWEQQRQKLEAFVRLHGRQPRARPTQKEPLLKGERELALWRMIQRQREQGMGVYAALSAEQQAALEGTPLWRRGGGL